MPRPLSQATHHATSTHISIRMYTFSAPLMLSDVRVIFSAHLPNCCPNPSVVPRAYWGAVHKVLMWRTPNVRERPLAHLGLGVSAGYWTTKDMRYGTMSARMIWLLDNTIAANV